MTDWATDLITEITPYSDADDAMLAFCAAYAVREVWRGSYVEYTFSDGSRYRDSNQGVDRFYPPGFGRDDRDLADDEPWEQEG